MPKILIMILSFKDAPYGQLMKAQQETFDSIKVEGVETIYYCGGYEQTTIHINDWSMECIYDITDNYFKMAGKFKRCLQQIHECGNEYDFIFRSNSSSYLQKQRLKEFAATLPTEKLYAGKTLVDVNDFSGISISGAGIWLSRDTAEILRNEIDPNFEMEEDIYISRILRKRGVVALEDNSRYDVPDSIPDDISLNRYHYRCKTGNRMQDVHNMRELHKLITA